MKYILLINVLFLGACNQSPKVWEFEKELLLDNVHPIGIAVLNNAIWLSDGDGNRLVQIDEEGNIVDQIKGLERPMHIDVSEGTLLVPEYGKDIVALYAEKVKDSLKEVPKLDAPAGVSAYKKELAIADFYNNTVHYYNGEKWLKVGKKGTDLGLLNYPTDVQITEEYIYVADAYNHRIQIFDKQGKFIKVLANDQGINATTGLLVHTNSVYVTDFENNRVLVFSANGELQQVIDTGLSKPTDILVFKEKLYVLNYKSGSVSVFVVKD